MKMSDVTSKDLLRAFEATVRTFEAHAGEDEPYQSDAYEIRVLRTEIFRRLQGYGNSEVEAPAWLAEVLEERTQ